MIMQQISRGKGNYTEAKIYKRIQMSWYKDVYPSRFLLSMHTVMSHLSTTLRFQLSSKNLLNFYEVRITRIRGTGQTLEKTLITRPSIESKIFIQE